MKDKQFRLNLLSAPIAYGVVLVADLLVSRLLLIHYGSAYHGLFSSVNRIFTYLALAEAGIGTATIHALYGPIADRDQAAIGQILSASRSSYLRCGILYFLGVVAVSIVLPGVLDTDLPTPVIGGMVFFQGVAGVLQFVFCATATNYLTAAGKNYVNSRIHLGLSLLTCGTKILLCVLDLSPLLICLVTVPINGLQCLIYWRYLSKTLPGIHRKTPHIRLPQRTYFMIHELSGVVFSATDTVVLSLFCGLEAASIYAVYAMVTSALRTAIGQIFQGTKYLLGKAFLSARETGVQFLDAYNALFIGLNFALYTVALVLLPSFVELFTAGVDGVSYALPYLPLLLVLVELLSACRTADGEIIRLAQHARQTLGRSMAEAAVNLLLSLLFVQFWGIYGVLLGTVAALLYRVNDMILYVAHRLLHRKAREQYRIYIGNFLLFFLLSCTRCALPPINSFGQLVALAIPLTVGALVLYGLLNILLCPALRQIIGQYGRKERNK